MSCNGWTVKEHRRVVKWLRRHKNYIPLYQKMKYEILENPLAYEKLWGGRSAYRRHKRGDLRVVFEVRDCLIVIVAVGLRKNIYKELLK